MAIDSFRLIAWRICKGSAASALIFLGDVGLDPPDDFRLRRQLRGRSNRIGRGHRGGRPGCGFEQLIRFEVLKRPQLFGLRQAGRPEGSVEFLPANGRNQRDRYAAAVAVDTVFSPAEMEGLRQGLRPHVEHRCGASGGR